LFQIKKVDDKIFFCGYSREMDLSGNFIELNLPSNIKSFGCGENFALFLTGKKNKINFI
jgi:hypothetical protein